MVTTKKTVTKYTPKEMRKGLKHFTAKKKKKNQTLKSIIWEMRDHKT